ncbi:MAG: serine hydrolase [Candidatus Daviesbacteria bacterium]|nr:serine hydrolase [Candidatus Daviesbacteria bacterium]
MIIERRRKKNWGRFFVLIFIGIICLYFLYYFFSGKDKSGELISPLVFSLATTPVPVNNLEAAVLRSLVGTKGSYAVSIKNLQKNEKYNLKEHLQFDAGSLYKLWVMAEVFKQIESGALKESDILSEDIATLNNIFGISKENAELKEGTITLTISSALTQMITISHNYAAMLLTKRIKLSTVDLFLKRSGFDESKVGNVSESPKTTASDIALFFEKLYKGELANPENTIKMIDLLKGQKLNDKLPKNLPAGLEIAHKTGEIEYFSHDGGIVYTEKGDYIIVVLSKSDIPTAAEDKISQISKQVYDYFQK